MYLFLHCGLALGMHHAAGAKIKESHPMVQIVIADDHPIVREAVLATLQKHSGFEVCAVVEEGAKAVEEALRLKPDVVVLNVSMPVLNGFEAAREITARLPETAIVILSSNA